MDGYGYGYRSGYSTYNGAPPRANEWSEASYASDHVCRPVIVDAEGRKTPIIVSIPNRCGQSYVAKVETVVEHVRVPVFTQYRHSSPPKIEPVKDYGYRYGSPPKVEPVKDYGYRYGSPPKVEPMKDYGYRYGSPPKVEPMKIYGRVKPPSKVEPVRDYGYKHSSFPRPVEPVNDSRYRYSSPPKVEPLKDYGYGYSSGPRVGPVNDFGYRYSSPQKVEPTRDVYGYKPSSLPRVELVNDYGYKQSSLPKVEPVKDYGYRNNSPPKVEPEKDYGFKTEVKDKFYNADKLRRPSSPAEDRPQEVEDFLAKVQTEASRPSRFPNAANWRQVLAPPSNANNGDNNNNNKDDYSRKNDAATEPTTVTTGGWARPSRSAWRAAPASREGTLGKPTSDIAEAVENLKEAATGLSVASGGPPLFSRNPAPKREAYAETIDSREAARRYGNFNGSSRPEKAGDQTFTATIDSKEAARRYGGANVD